MATLSLDFLRNYRLGTYRESEPVAYQYDQGHVLDILVPGAVASAEVQYWTRGMTEAAAYEVGSITQQTDGSYVIECNVPNEFFDTWGDLRVYLVVTDDSKYVVTYEGRIKVLQREKPEDYVDDDPDNEALRVLTEAREAAQSASADADRAAQVAASIPADYTDLSNQVSSLNERLEDEATNLGQLTQAIIDGKVTKGDATETFSPSSSDFIVAKVTPKDGVIGARGSAYMRVNDVSASYYPLLSDGFLDDEIIEINSLYNDVRFVLFVYDSEGAYLGCIYDEYLYKTAAELKVNNILLPYTNVDMVRLRSMFPTYKFKLEITDVTANSASSGSLPEVTDIASWCEYKRNITIERQLVKTVNGESPDGNGNVTVGTDMTLSISGKAADAGAVGTALTSIESEISSKDEALRQQIINGKVTLPSGVEEVDPDPDDFIVARCTPKNGVIAPRGNAYMNITGTSTTYYTLLSNDILPDDILRIQSKYNDVKFVLFAYSKADSSYLGGIYREYEFRSAAGFEANNVLYPYSDVDMVRLRTLFPDYDFKLEITDSVANVVATGALPSTTDITSWCKYYKVDLNERQLVKSVNNVEPDPNGNVTVVFDDRIIVETEETSEGYEAGKYNMSSGNRGSGTESIRVNDTNYNNCLGIRMSPSVYIDRDYDYIKTDESTIYFYVQAWEKGRYIGFYHYATNEFYTAAVSPNQGPTAYQYLDISRIHEEHPTYDLRLSIVDISTTERIPVTDAEYIVYGWNKETKKLAQSNLKRIRVLEDDLNELESKSLPLPSYFETQLSEKIPQIRANMEAVGRNGETFIFITDLHWPSNVKNSPAVVKRIIDETNITDVICGGDIINEGTYEVSEAAMMDCINAFKVAGITFPVLFGNHDSNWNDYLDQREHPERHFSSANVYAMMEKQYMERKRVFFSGDFNFYIDIDETNTRFIFIDSGEDRTIGEEEGIMYRDYNTLAQVLNDSGDRNIVIFSHSITTDSIGARLCRIGMKYNARETYEPSYGSFDFTNAQGHVYGVIGGHAHSSNFVNVDNGLPYIVVDTDSKMTHAEAGSEVGTVNEQGFDVVTIDYATGTFHIVGIGRCLNRTIYASV